MDKNKIPLNIYLDLSKAFDTLDHAILLDKLFHYGIRGNPLILRREEGGGRRGEGRREGGGEAGGRTKVGVREEAGRRDEWRREEGVGMREGVVMKEK